MENILENKINEIMDKRAEKIEMLLAYSYVEDMFNNPTHYNYGSNVTLISGEAGGVYICDNDKNYFRYIDINEMSKKISYWLIDKFGNLNKFNQKLITKIAKCVPYVHYVPQIKISNIYEREIDGKKLSLINTTSGLFDIESRKLFIDFTTSEKFLLADSINQYSDPIVFTYVFTSSVEDINKEFSKIKGEFTIDDVDRMMVIRSNETKFKLIDYTNAIIPGKEFI
jgi:hypothetical protein